MATNFRHFLTLLNCLNELAFPNFELFLSEATNTRPAVMPPTRPGHDGLLCTNLTRRTRCSFSVNENLKLIVKIQHFFV